LLEELEDRQLEHLELLELQMPMLLLEYLRLDLVEAEVGQVLALVEATVQLVAFLPVAAGVELQLNLEHNLEMVALAQMAWQSSQLTSKHEIRSNQFRNKHRGERRHLGRRDSLDSSCWLLC